MGGGRGEFTGKGIAPHNIHVEKYLGLGFMAWGCYPLQRGSGIIRDITPSGEAERKSNHWIFRGFPKLWVPFWGPYNKDYSIWGPPILGNYHLGFQKLGQYQG